MLRLAIASSGNLHEPALQFLQACGMSVSRPNPRRYAASIPALPGVVVHFQRQSDIPLKVEEGTADMGIVGFDSFLERRREGGNTNVVIDQLGFGHSELVVEIPDSWVDVTSISDLADLAVEFREEGKDLRVTTKYPRLVERFLLANGVNYFTIIASSGTLEAAPAMGYADIIADISSTGTTMQANRLKTIHGGAIMKSQACLIGNHELLKADATKLAQATALVERIEAYQQSRNYYSITANLRGEGEDAVAQYVLQHTDISGLRGPTISKVYTRDGVGWYAVTVIVEKSRLQYAVDRLREIGAVSVTVMQPNYVFRQECKAVARLTGGEKA